MKPEAYVGTPYSALDCFALVREVARNCFGITYPELIEHSPFPAAVVSEQLASGLWQEVPFEERQPGDVVTLSHTSAVACHVGVAIAGGWVLHNDKKYGAIIHDLAGLRRRGYLYRKAYRWQP